jgi:trehalose/maltose transport system substrate-binding protein
MAAARKLILGTCLLAAAAASAGPKPPKLRIDCSFTGPAGDFCKEASLAWAKQKGVELEVERTVKTSTEKYAQYSKFLAAGRHDFDIFGLDVIWPGALHKQLLDLKPFLADRLQQFLPIYIENNTVHGRLLAAPYNVGVGLLFYRKDLLEKHGEKVPETWEQLTAVARKIQDAERKAGDKKIWGYVFQGKAYEGLTCNALEWIGSYNGGTIIDSSTGAVTLNRSHVLTALELASAWVGSITPPETLKMAEAESHEFFNAGRAVFLRGWPSSWPIIAGPESPMKDKVGVVVLPKGGERGIHASTLGGWSIAVARSTPYPELAADLIRYLSDLPEQRKRALGGAGGPTVTSLYQDPEVQANAPYYRVILPVLAQAELRPSRITRQLYPEVSKLFWSGIHRILSRKAPVAKVVSELQGSLEKLSVRWRRETTPPGARGGSDEGSGAQ